METEKSFSGEEAEKDFCDRLFFLAAIFPFSNEKACLGVTAKTDFFDRLRRSKRPSVFFGAPAGIRTPAFSALRAKSFDLNRLSARRRKRLPPISRSCPGVLVCRCAKKQTVKKTVSACRKRSPQGGLFLVKQGEIWYNKYG